MGGGWFKATLDRMLDAILPPVPRPAPLTLAEALPWLVPRVLPRFTHEAMGLRTGRSGPEFRPLAGSFAVSLVLDLPDREWALEAADLARWNTDFDRLMQRARSNLLARGGAEGFHRLGPGRYRSTWQDNLDGSRVLLPGVLRGLELEGDPVVLLPNRDTLVVVGSEDPASLRWALEGALEFLNEDPRSLNGCPLRYRHYQWEPFLAPEEQDLRPLLGRIQKRRLREEYAHQKVLLDRRHDSLGRAITVAPFRLERTASGQTGSFTVWSGTREEVWLPEADRLCLDLASGRTWLSWEAARRRLSHLLEPVGLFPERYRFRDLPGADVLEQLLGRA